MSIVLGLLDTPSYEHQDLMTEISSAGTFKLKKQDLQVEGFNPHHIKDKLYFLMGEQYVPLTEKLYGDIINGTVRL